MATWLSGYSRQHRTIRRNAVIWCGIFAAVFLLLGCRLLWLQTVRGHFLQAQAASYINRIEVLAARRGELLDRDHKALALDDTRDSLYVDPEMVDNAAFVAGQLAPVIGRPEQEIVDTITRQLPFIWIKQAIAPTIATTVDSLKLPGVTVQADGARYRVGANPALLPASTGVAAALATAAGMKQATLITALGIPTALPQEQSGPVDPEADMPAKGAPAKHAAKVAKPAPAPVKPLPPPPSEQRWLPGEFNEASANAVQALHFTGVTVEKLGPSFSVGVDPRLYLNHTAPMTADAVADRLAPLLGMTHDAVVRRLLFKPRFAWLYRGLSEEMSNAVQKLQGTFYVLTPGIAASVPLKDEKTADPEARLTAVVERLYKMINPQPKHVKRGQTPEPVVELISHDAIRAKLVAGAAPGPLIEKLDDGRPVLSIIRRLKQEPIPGVVYGLPGVSTKQERRRRYPFSNMASATLGFVGYWNDAFHGAFGLEQSEDKTLRGEDGKIKREIDTHRMSIPESDVMLKAPVNGCNVVTTLSTDIQQVADDELGKAVDATHALRGACVVMDCNTGEILAMATYPNWDANAPGKSTLPLVHTAVSNWYEPGSTFKTMTVLAALEEGTIHDGENVTYCSGALTVGNHTIHEAHGAHGEVDCGRLLEQSCNLGAATLAMKLGPTRFLKWCDRLGFGKPTGVEIANESTGSLNRRKRAR